MSIFNEANEFASQVVYSQHYQCNDDCARPNGVSESGGVLKGELRFSRDGETNVLCLDGRPVNHGTWATLACEIQRLFREGWDYAESMFRDSR